MRGCDRRGNVRTPGARRPASFAGGIQPRHAGAAGRVGGLGQSLRRWCRKLAFQKQALIKRLAELLPDEKIRDLKLRVGPVA